MRELRNKIRQIFDEAQDNQEALGRIYQFFIPEWDQIGSIDGWPSCGNRLHHFILENFMLYDCVHHPQDAAGLLWANKGFIEDPRLGGWEVHIPKAKSVIECIS